MMTKFLSRNGETHRVLHQDKDTCWMISFDDPKRPFNVAVAELDSFQRIPAPQDFAPKDSDLSPAAQKRLAIIQPLLDQDLAAITDHQLRRSIAKDIADNQNTTVRRVLRLYYRYLATGQVSFTKNKGITVNDTYDWAIKTLYFFSEKVFIKGYI